MIPTQNHEQIGPQIHFFLFWKYENENCQLPPHVTEVINVFQGHIKCSTFCIAVNIWLCNDYLHMQFELLLEPPDPAGAERKKTSLFQMTILIQFTFAFPTPKKIFVNEKMR